MARIILAAVIVVATFFLVFGMLTTPDHSDKIYAPSVTTYADGTTVVVTITKPAGIEFAFLLVKSLAVLGVGSFATAAVIILFKPRY